MTTEAETSPPSQGDLRDAVAFLFGRTRLLGDRLDELVGKLDKLANGLADAALAAKRAAASDPATGSAL